MSEVTPSPNPVAQLPQETQPNESLGQPQSTPQTPPNVPQGANGVASSLADEKKAMFAAADQKIADGNKNAGVTLITPAKTHEDRVSNAAKVYYKLASNPKTKDEAETFLKELAAVGKKLGYNFGFKEIIKINNSQPAAQSTGSNTAAPQTPSKDDGTPLPTDTQGTGGDVGKPTAQQLSDLKKVLTEVAGQDGEISRADIAKSPDQIKALLQGIDAQQKVPGTPMSVVQVIERLVNPDAGKPNSSATEPPPQNPNSPPTESTPRLW